MENYKNKPFVSVKTSQMLWPLPSSSLAPSTYQKTTKLLPLDFYRKLTAPTRKQESTIFNAKRKVFSSGE